MLLGSVKTRLVKMSCRHGVEVVRTKTTEPESLVQSCNELDEPVEPEIRMFEAPYADCSCWRNHLLAAALPGMKLLLLEPAKEESIGILHCQASQPHPLALFIDVIRPTATHSFVF
jgi:hypothetical protein